MKLKIFLLSCLVGLGMFSSCSDQDELIIPDNNTTSGVISNPIIEAAENAYALCYPSSSRYGSATFFQQDIVPVTTLKSRASSPDTILYIVNEADGNGFVALTGGQHPQVLAVSNSGTITDLESIDNPGLKLFFDAAKDYSESQSIGGGIELPDVPIPYFKEVLVTDADVTVPARCTVQWGQEYPEGLFCPNNISGCSPTAAAQAMSYFELPANINLTYEGADKSSIEINWGDIKTYSKSLSWNEYNSDQGFRRKIQFDSEENLGRICRQLGNLMGSLYLSDDGTSTEFFNLNATVRHLCPTLKVSGCYSGIPIARNVLEDGIIIMRGERYTDSQDENNFTHYKCSGHSWLVDGYIYRIIHHQIYKLNSEGQYEYSESASFTESTDLQHINWGWRGKCNGYFALGVFSPAAVVTPDTENNSSSYNYSHAFLYFTVKH